MITQTRIKICSRLSCFQPVFQELSWLAAGWYWYVCLCIYLCEDQSEFYASGMRTFLKSEDNLTSTHFENRSSKGCLLLWRWAKGKDVGVRGFIFSLEMIQVIVRQRINPLLSIFKSQITEPKLAQEASLERGPHKSKDLSASSSLSSIKML